MNSTKIFFILSYFWISAAWAVDIPLNPLTVEKVELSSRHISPGSNAEVQLHIRLLPDHHAYLEQFKLASVPENSLKIGKLQISPIVSFYDKFSKKTKKGIESQAVIKAAFEVPENAMLGEFTYKLQLTYQACTKTYCHLPKTAEVLLKLNLVDEKTITLGNEKMPTLEEEDSSPFNRAHNQGWFYLILFVFFAGLLTSFTPCIFPMIPITLTILSGHKHLSHWQGFLRSCIYVLGIALTYVGLGLFAASTGSLFGSFLGSPIFAVFLALLFFAMALSMFGAFELKPPHFIEVRLMKIKTSSSFKGVFIAGLLAGAVASPCVGPVLIGVLTFVAKSQDLLLGGVLLFAFALGFGSLFIVLGTFSQALQKLPKAGHWMIEVKDFFGWTLLALSLYYLRPVLSDKIWWLLVSLTLISISSVFGAFLPSEKLNKWLSFKKGALLTAFFVGVFIFIKSLFPGSLATEISLVKTNSDNLIQWQNYSESTLQEARANNKPVVIDFWADWCATCKDLEETTFRDPKVLKYKDNFVWIKYDATQITDEFKELQKKYEILGLPHLTFYSPKGVHLKSKTLNGFEDAQEFSQRLSEVLYSQK